VNPSNLEGGHRGEAIVAAAGPISNLVMAVAAALPLRYIIANPDLAVQIPDLVIQVLFTFVYINLILMIFNLIPIPPLDGSRIVAVFLPDDAYRQWARLDAYGMILVLGLFLVFRDESSTLLSEAYDAVTEVMVKIVGA
jgi:Zn-dependent protease